jgi:hypothetical protein
VYPYPKSVVFRKFIDSQVSLVELDIKVTLFDPVLFVFINKARNLVGIIYWDLILRLQFNNRVALQFLQPRRMY